jgi:hypothetical protein
LHNPNNSIGFANGIEKEREERVEQTNNNN